MTWSFSLGRVFGTDIRIHLTFLLLLAWFGVSAAAQGGAVQGLRAIVFIVAVFFCVLLHEFGHVVIARAYGIGTRDITLLPIGGVASIERIPDNPRQELLIAAAGPVVNLVIAGVLIALLGADINLERINQAVDAKAFDFVSHLALVNVTLFAFNLLLAFPMDGGRILRAALSSWIDRIQATRIAATIGQAVAFVLGFLGLFGNPLLIFVALFVFLAARQESMAVELVEATRSVSARRATITSFATLGIDATVGDAADRLLSTAQREFPVIDGSGRMQGVLTRDGMIQALSVTGSETPVRDVMLRDVRTIYCRAPLADAVTVFQIDGMPLLGVVDDDSRVIGIITVENLAEYMMIAEAGRKHRHPDEQPS